MTAASLLPFSRPLARPHEHLVAHMCVWHLERRQAPAAPAAPAPPGADKESYEAQGQEAHRRSPAEPLDPAAALLVRPLLLLSLLLTLLSGPHPACCPVAPSASTPMRTTYLPTHH